MACVERHKAQREVKEDQEEDNTNVEMELPEIKKTKTNTNQTAINANHSRVAVEKDQKNMDLIVTDDTEREETTITKSLGGTTNLKLAYL